MPQPQPSRRDAADLLAAPAPGAEVTDATGNLTPQQQQEALGKVDQREQHIRELYADPRFAGFKPDQQRQIVGQLFPDNEVLSALPHGVNPTIGTPLSGTPLGGLVNTVTQAVQDPATIAGTLADVAGPEGMLGKSLAVGVAAGVGQTVNQWLKDEPFDPMAAAQTGLTQGAGAGVGSMAIRAVGKVLGVATDTFSPAVTQEAAEAYRWLSPRFAAKGFKGPVLDAAEMTDSSLLDTAYNIASASLLGGGAVKSYEAKRNTVLQDIGTDLVDQLGQQMAPSDLAKLFKGGVEKRINLSKMVATPLYNTVTAATDGALFQTAGIKDAGKIVADLSKSIGDVAAEKSGAAIMRRLATLGDTTNFTQLQELRSLLLLEQQTFMKGARVPAKKLARMNSAIGEVDAAIEEGMRVNGLDEYLPVWRDANKLTSERYKDVESAFLKRLVKTSDPAALGQGGGKGGDALVDAVFDTPESIRATQKALTEKAPAAKTSVFGPATALDSLDRTLVPTRPGEASPEWRSLQRRYLEKTMQQATDATGTIQGQALETLLTGKGAKSTFGGEQAERFAAAFPAPAYRNDLAQFARALDVTQRAEGQGKPGRMFIQMAQGGALVAAFSGLGKKAATILLSPSILAHMLTSPTGVKLLTRSLRLPPTAEAAASLATRIYAERNRLAADIPGEPMTQAESFDAAVPAPPTAGTTTTTTPPTTTTLPVFRSRPGPGPRPSPR